MNWLEPELSRVPVNGGQLQVARWGHGEHIIVASHGITGNHRTFGQVAAAMQEHEDDVTLLAVDHRGRGGSSAVEGAGIVAHARDVLAVLAHAHGGTAVLVGHSMGAFVVSAAAELAPERITALVLVDGGPPITSPAPPDADPEHVVRAVLGPTLDRLDTRFESMAEYLDAARALPSLDEWNDVIEASLRYDLAPSSDGWRSRVSRETVLADGFELFGGAPVTRSLERIHTPTRILLAERGLQGEAPPLFRDEVVAATRAGLDHVATQRVAGTTHSTILLGERGAPAVRGAIIRALHA